MGRKPFIDHRSGVTFRLPQINERFEALFETYSNSRENDEEMDLPKTDGSGQHFFQQDQFSEERFQRELPDRELKEAVLRDAKTMEEDDLVGRGQTEAILTDSTKKSRWDCESILSTYSTLYNHPTEIKEPMRSIGRRKGRPYKLEEMEIDDGDGTKTPSVHTRISMVSSVRPKGETAEERRTRKNAVKEERRERRKEKKANTESFRAERLKLEAQRKTAQPRMTRPIH